MEKKWVRRDFSKESRIEESLLKELLARYKKTAVQEIPENYLEQIAAAGPDKGEIEAMEELKKKLNNGKKES